MSCIVFISDLHLNPEEPEITNRFHAFVDWAKTHVNTLYILGDFFHAWAGDDAMDDWSQGIAARIRDLVDHQIPVYFMHGNRDFLLGKRFAKAAGWTVLPDPYVLKLDSESILLTHGDALCTADLKHQRFRKLTRNPIFTFSFQLLPLSWRQRLVNQVRYKSQMDKSKTLEQMDVVDDAVIALLERYSINQMIHGHTHKPGLSVIKTTHSANMSRYVLSDWDDEPLFLCYNQSNRIYYNELSSEE